MECKQEYETPAFYFQWHFLETCNLRCKHCYQDGYVPRKVDFHLVSVIIEQIQKVLATWNMPGRVSITGGEPFLDTKTLFFILDELSAIEEIKHLGILTNGTLLTNELVARLSSYSKLKEVQISFDGASPLIHDEIRGAGSFGKSVRGLKKLVAAQIPTAIMFTASKINASEAVNIIDFADRMGVSAITVERYTPFHEKNNDPLSLTPEITRQIYRNVLSRKERLQREGHPLKIRTSRPLWSLLSDTCGGVCPVGYSCLTIMHDGTVYPCRRLPVSLGKVQEDGLFKIWYTSPVLWQIRNRNNVEKCANCTQNTSCGGCRAAAFADSNDFMGKDPLCWKE